MERRDDDFLLIRRSQNGEHEAFGLLYRKYAEQVRRYFARRVRERETAEDLMQDTFVRALEHVGRFEDRSGSYSGYLFTIAHNILVNYYRRKQELSLEEAEDIPDRASEKAARAAEFSFDVRKMRNAARGLAPAEQRAVVSKYWHGRSVKEIAHATHRTENAVKLALSRGRRKLAAHPALRHLTPFLLLLCYTK